MNKNIIMIMIIIEYVAVKMNVKSKLNINALLY